MKKILFATILVLITTGTMLAQISAGDFYVGSASRSSVLYVMKPFAPWASDSSVQAYTGNFNIADFDSLKFFVHTYSNGASGNVNFWASLMVSTAGYGAVPTNTGATSFATARNSYDSISVCIDTTETKLKVFKVSSKAGIVTKGATVGKLILTPNLTGSNAATINGTKSVIDIWIVGYKRQFTGTY